MASSRKLPGTDDVDGAVVGAVSACLGRWVSPCQSVTVGLSGGVDSVVLLHALRRVPVPLSAIHVHHGLSPNADAWQRHCEELCARWSVPLTVVRVTVSRASDKGPEGAARQARHGALAKASADWIALAHHQGDQVETLLFNLLRGTGLRGAGAMAERRDRLLRPLLPLGRGTIMAYAENHGLSWIDDESNADIRYSRNFLRHLIVPHLCRRFPAAETTLAAAARRFAEAQGLLDDLAALDLAERPHEFPVEVVWLSSLAEARARNVLRYLLALRGVGVPSEERLVEALRQFLTAAPDRHPSVIMGSWQLFRRRGRIELEPS